MAKQSSIESQLKRLKGLSYNDAIQVSQVIPNDHFLTDKQKIAKVNKITGRKLTKIDSVNGLARNIDSALKVLAKQKPNQKEARALTKLKTDPSKTPIQRKKQFFQNFAKPKIKVKAPKQPKQQPTQTQQQLPKTSKIDLSLQESYSIVRTKNGYRTTYKVINKKAYNRIMYKLANVQKFAITGKLKDYRINLEMVDSNGMIHYVSTPILRIGTARMAIMDFGIDYESYLVENGGDEYIVLETIKILKIKNIFVSWYY